MSVESGSFEVEVVYALPHRQWSKRVTVPRDTSVRQAIELSGVLAAHPEIDPTRLMVGIWNRRTMLDAVVRHDDRIEIYRPLKADPKEARRRRARAR